MSKRSFHEIPDVQALAKPARIGRAYPQDVSASHPGVGQRPRVRAIEFVMRPWVRSNELPRRKPSVVIPDDFLTMSPSTEELIDHIAQNFFGYRRKSGGPYCSMDIDALLNSEDARFGCHVPFRIRFYMTCQECGGTCLSWGLCSQCHGSGVIGDEKQAMLEVMPGARDGERHKLDLSGVGIGNLLLQVKIILN
jgi:DnaJ-class molecular chaperone